MNEAEVSRYITDTFKGVDVVISMETSFFFYNPDNDVPPDHRFPFVTLVTSDIHDQFSNLNRPSIYRLNIGVSKQTYRSLFNLTETPSGEDSTPESSNNSNSSNYDFTALDQLMPHPVYSEYYWVCILNPSLDTFQTQVRPLLEEAYKMAVSRYDRKIARRSEQENQQ